MLRHARLATTALSAAARERLTRPLGRQKKLVVVTGTALALAGAGSASAATIGGGAPAHSRHPAVLAAARRHAWNRHATARHATSRPSRLTTEPTANPAPLPAADQLMPVGTSGPQSSMTISGAQLANATTIVQQAMAKQMGVRSAVIAVATAMQESELQNLGYGDADSLGLFQQQPSDGWGTAQQIMDPVYASDAFLNVLQQYEASNPGWASQPLWETAQAVQKSGYPFAYAQWEAQAAQLVQQITHAPQ